MSSVNEKNQFSSESLRAQVGDAASFFASLREAKDSVRCESGMQAAMEAIARQAAAESKTSASQSTLFSSAKASHNPEQARNLKPSIFANPSQEEKASTEKKKDQLPKSKSAPAA